MKKMFLGVMFFFGFYNAYAEKGMESIDITCPSSVICNNGQCLPSEKISGFTEVLNKPSLTGTYTFVGATYGQTGFPPYCEYVDGGDNGGPSVLLGYNGANIAPATYTISRWQNATYSDGTYWTCAGSVYMCRFYFGTI